MEKPKNFHKDMSIEEILCSMDKNDGNTEKMQAGHCFLQYQLHKELIREQNKLHKEMLDEQRGFQKDYLNKTQCLVWATWALVIVTLVLVFVPKS